MFKLVEQAQGVKKLKAMDLTKSMKEMFGDEVDKKLCKLAIKQLVDSGKCVYTYFGGSYIELPHREAAAND
uniref:DsrD protein n=1 Tax=uncultured sulfate-reducing bacterium TaxID=153939 RepID=Q3IBI4_9BACT|nr:dsrD [uncultured sulfate-reducing bacterium]